MMLAVFHEVGRRLAHIRDDERGLNTAELLGNAALAIVALIAIWGALRILGVDIIDEIRRLVFEETG
ncbi:MAG: hypothetical protein OES24_21765 [Acidimicrobiia bacterium]|nr:hypothetical protein [Acidimicrobiia bacterium]